MPQDLSGNNWFDIQNMCPMECEVWKPEDEDYVETIGDFGLPVRRAQADYVKGTLTVVSTQYGYQFSHPGFKNGTFFVHALRTDEATRYKSVFIRTD